LNNVVDNLTAQLARTWSLEQDDDDGLEDLQFDGVNVSSIPVNESDDDDDDEEEEEEEIAVANQNISRTRILIRASSSGSKRRLDTTEETEPGSSAFASIETATVSRDSSFTNDRSPRPDSGNSQRPDSRNSRRRLSDSSASSQGGRGLSLSPVPTNPRPASALGTSRRSPAPIPRRRPSLPASGDSSAALIGSMNHIVNAKRLHVKWEGGGLIKEEEVQQIFRAKYGGDVVFNTSKNNPNDHYLFLIVAENRTDQITRELDGAYMGEKESCW